MTISPHKRPVPLPKPMLTAFDMLRCTGIAFLNPAGYLNNAVARHQAAPRRADTIMTNHSPCYRG